MRPKGHGSPVFINILLPSYFYPIFILKRLKKVGLAHQILLFPTFGDCLSVGKLLFGLKNSSLAAEKT
jgi:hypothetical protein